MILKYINPYIFLISFFIGMFIVYITIPIPEIIYQFPRPDNNNLVYKDDSGMCYKMIGQQVKCPKDIKNIEPYIVQDSFVIDTPKF